MYPTRLFSRLYGVPYKADQTILSSWEYGRRFVSRVRSHSCAIMIQRMLDIEGGSVEASSNRALSSIGE